VVPPAADLRLWVEIVEDGVLRGAGVIDHAAGPTRDSALSEHGATLRRNPDGHFRC
jgi:hypothetical protein